MKAFYQVNKLALAAWMVFAVLQKIIPALANNPPPLEKEFLDALKNSGYVFPAVIVIQGFLAIALLTKKLEFFALLLFIPIVFNIVMLHVTLAPENILKTLILLAMVIFALFEHKSKVKALFR